MRITPLALIGLLAAYPAAAVAAEMPRARFVEGVAEGTRSDDVIIYRGLPYAAPPIGTLRWSAPHPARRWNGIRQAKAFSPACAQTAVWITEQKSEDCLYLNIWTPATTSSDKLPVIVWIHGGGYYGGSGAQPLYDGSHLTSRGVIVVTLNYRLGVFGFFAHPELTAHEHVTGNQGLLDQVAALTWVKRNIAAVGGDPNKVTIMGESAGAGSVAILTASPLAAGLFQRAIAESGSDGVILSDQEADQHSPLTAEAAGTALGKRLGHPSLEALRHVTAAQLLQQPWSSNTIVDGQLIPNDVHSLYRSGRAGQVPLLLGWNANEGVDLAPEILGTDKLTAANFRPLAEKLLRRPLTAAAAAAYPAGDDTQARAAIEHLTTDWWGSRMWTWADVHRTAAQPPTYLYYFVHWPAEPVTPCGYGCRAGHGAEIPFVFDQLAQDKRAWTANDHMLSSQMVTYWTNFAKYGDPNGLGMPHWSRFDGGQATVKRFGDDAEIKARGALPNFEILAE
jgi:para-nitrobenzyl esterase